jgi:hypothetical protein
MRPLFFTLLMFLFFFSGVAQDSKPNGPEITFDKLVHDFGKVIQGDKTEFDFKFSNTGKEPLIISDVRSTCGCTVPEWPKNPILPGSSANIKVKYNSTIIGNINKQVTIISNSSNSPTVLRIAGMVEKLPSEILPFQQQTAVPSSTTNK